MMQDAVTQAWTVTPDTNCMVGLIAEGQTAYDAFPALTDVEMIAAFSTYLQNIYLTK
jgi:hypothetical protein